ncbi:MAG: shikimate kinase [Acidimicrobiia bacterium]
MSTTAVAMTPAAANTPAPTTPAPNTAAAANAKLGDRHLVLVGLMGTGKSTVARRLARRLGRPLVDTDALVESRAGRSVRDIFAESGEDGFRDLEAEVVRSVLQSATPSVVAGAGGIVLRAENRLALTSSRAYVVWLRADPVVLARRVRGQGHRPALDGDPLGRLMQMHTTREPLYREVAQSVVDTETLDPEGVCNAVLTEVSTWNP